MAEDQTETALGSLCTLFADLVAEGKAVSWGGTMGMGGGAGRAGRGDSLVGKALATQPCGSEFEFPALA